MSLRKLPARDGCNFARLDKSGNDVKFSEVSDKDIKKANRRSSTIFIQLSAEERATVAKYIAVCRRIRPPAHKQGRKAGKAELGVKAKREITDAIAASEDINVLFSNSKSLAIAIEACRRCFQSCITPIAVKMGTHPISGTTPEVPKATAIRIVELKGPSVSLARSRD